MRILIATYAFPKPDRSSGDRRFFEIIKLLAPDNELWLWTCQPEPELPVEQVEACRARLVSLGIHLCPWPEPLEVAFSRQAYDVGFFEFYWIAEPCLSWFRLAQPQAIVVVDSVDVHFAREELASRLGVSGAADAAKTKQREMDVYRRADAVIAVSEADREILLAEAPSLRVGVVRNIVTPSRSELQRNAEEVIFIGCFLWPPNPDGIGWFVREIWPAVRSAVQCARLTVVGSDPTDEVKALGKEPGVTVVGYVPDTGPYLERAAVSVAPLRYGGGMKGKVNEAMSWGLPVVTTAVGAQGINAEHGKHLLVADTPQEFAAAVIHLLTNRTAREQMGEMARSYTTELCSPQKALCSMDTLFLEAGRQRKPRLVPVAWRVHLIKFHLKAIAKRYRIGRLLVRAWCKLLRLLAGPQLI